MAYSFPSLKEAQAFRAKDYDFIITSQEPAVDSLVGLYLKRKSPHLRWTVDTADPLTVLYSPIWRPSIDEFLERKILIHADVVINTCKEEIDYFIRKCKVNERKFHVINQRFCESNLSKNKGKNEKLAIVYSGTFFKHFRDPENFTEAPKELPFVCGLIAIGRNEHFLLLMKRFGNRLCFKELIPHFQAIEYQGNADILLYIGNRQIEQISGKFFEYLGANAPILTIAYNDCDEIAYLTEKVKIGLVCKNRKEEIKKALTLLYNAWEEDKVSKLIHQDFDRKIDFSWQTQDKKLLNLLLFLQAEKDAVNVLKNLRNEMDRRFDYLEEKKLKEIDPKRDKMDKIIIGVDEASVLYTKVKSDSAKKKYIVEARELTDELSKLSRAAGIHLILATQKVTKETIDTKVQENIGGRMCFQMNTLQGSMTVLGNKMALNLPDIKGRGIWSSGNKFTEIQAPFLSEDELETELTILGKEYENKTRKFFGPMVALDKVEGEKKKAVSASEENESKKDNEDS